MQGNNPYSNILSQVRSRDDLNLLLDELSALKNSLYQTKENTFEQVLKNKVREKIASEVEKMLVVNPDKIVLVDELTKAVHALKSVDLTLAFEPTKETVERISDWVKTNMGEGVVIDIKFDKSIVGGAQVSFEGKYADLSLKKVMDRYLEKNKVLN